MVNARPHVASVMPAGDRMLVVDKDHYLDARDAGWSRYERVGAVRASAGQVYVALGCHEPVVTLVRRFPERYTDPLALLVEGVANMHGVGDRLLADHSLRTPRRLGGARSTTP